MGKLIVIHFARLGPYHLARLESAVEVLAPLGWKVLALETASADMTYEWDKAEAGFHGYQRETIFPDRVFEHIGSSELKRGVDRILDQIRPDVMAIAGWGTVDARACLAWCKRNGVRSIVMSETRAADGKRVWWKEWLKSRIVRQFDGALCGGQSHKRYLVQLGIPQERIALGYNIVDNEFFAGRGEEVKAESLKAGITTIEHRGRCEKEQPKVGPKGERVGASESKDAESVAPSRFSSGPAYLPATSYSPPATAPKALEPYFLASNRFVERKNLVRLMEAYAKYVKSFQEDGGKKPWPLVLLGDGELRGKLEEQCRDFGLAKASGDLKLNSYKLKTSSGGLVVFAGFRQIQELPGFYSQAGAFIHPALEEPWGLVINEAMASGLPVLSSRNVGAAEELVREGETGFLFDPKDVEVMAKKLHQMANMPEERRQEMGASARDWLETQAPKRAFGEGLKTLLLQK